MQVTLNSNSCSSSHCRHYMHSCWWFHALPTFAHLHIQLTAVDWRVTVIVTGNGISEMIFVMGALCLLWGRTWSLYQGQTRRHAVCLLFPAAARHKHYELHLTSHATLHRVRIPARCSSLSLHGAPWRISQSEHGVSRQELQVGSFNL